MKKNLTHTTLKEEQAEAAVKRAWERDEKLRQEFGDDLEACIAFHRAQARGAVKILGEQSTRG